MPHRWRLGKVTAATPTVVIVGVAATAIADAKSGAINPALLQVAGFQALTDTTDSDDSPGISIHAGIPDGAISANDSYVMVAINSGWIIFDHAGTYVESHLNNHQWPELGGYYEAQDIDVRYDSVANRWVHTALVAAGALNHSLAVAVSQTSDPTGSWYEWVFAGSDFGELDSTYRDRPLLGIDTNAVYLNFYHLDSGETHILAIKKSDLYSGAASPATVVRSTGSGRYAQPVGRLEDHDCMYWLQSGAGYPNEFDLVRWADPFGADTYTFTAAISMGTSRTGGVTSVEQKQSDGGEPTFDLLNVQQDSIQGAQFYNDTIYAVRDCAVDAWNCVRYFRVTGLTTTPTVDLDGVIGGSDPHRYYPGIAVDASGNMIMGYTVSSETTFTGLRMTGRDVDGNISNELEPVPGSGAMCTDGGSSPARSGDYSAMRLSADGLEGWYAAEYGAPFPATDPVYGHTFAFGVAAARFS